MRIRATNNVSKLTSVMKLVASSKLKAVEEALNRGRAFGESILSAIALKEDNSASTLAKGDEEATLNIFVDQPGAKVRLRKAVQQRDYDSAEGQSKAVWASASDPCRLWAKMLLGTGEGGNNSCGAVTSAAMVHLASS